MIDESHSPKRAGEAVPPSDAATPPALEARPEEASVPAVVARAEPPAVRAAGWKRPLLIALGVAGALVWFAVARWLQLRWAGPGIGNDIHLYRSYAGSWGAGAIPYVGFQPEYPPGALPLFVLPFLYAGAAGRYDIAFAIEMGIFDLASYLLVLLWATRLSRRPLLGAVALGTLYLALSAALYPVLYTRFDMVPAAIVLAALTLTYPPARDGQPVLSARRMFFSGALVGVAGAIKLWPLALGPTWLLLAFRRGRWPLLLAAAAGMGAGV
ncbi:MAG TPA: glycosyltransferase 87 family protein, partial [Polyangia bacterium]